MAEFSQKNKFPIMCEYITNRLYFLTLRARTIPKSTARFHFFSIDDEFVYVNYYSDFGPLNLGLLYKYCVKLNAKLKHTALSSKIIVHCTSCNPQKRANAAFLIASFAVIFLNMTPKEALKPLVSEKMPFLAFQDASLGKSNYKISLIDCLNGLYRALAFGFFHFNDFDLEEYEQYSKVLNGDLNWIVPQKFIAFSGPIDGTKSSYRHPEHYFNYFHFNKVTTIIRLNKKAYDIYKFKKAGFKHFDLYMIDGSAPTQAVTRKFLYISEQSDGAIAVHCKAGLGRTGSLIGAYLIKHYQMTAKEAIAWLRICRPGSVIGPQQAWLETIQPHLWRAGKEFRLKRFNDQDCFPHHRYGIYSVQVKYLRILQFNAFMKDKKDREFLENPKRNLAASGDTCYPESQITKILPVGVKEGPSRRYSMKPKRYGNSCGNNNLNFSKSMAQSFSFSNNSQEYPEKKVWRKSCAIKPMVECKENIIAKELQGYIPHTIKINKNEAPLTQGDRLNAIKVFQVNNKKN